MADNGCRSDQPRALRSLQAEACNYRIAFGSRTGQKMLTLQGGMPMETGFKQDYCADIDGFSHPACAATVSQDHPPGAVQRAGAVQRCWASAAEDEDTVARRHHAPGDFTAAVHALASGADPPA